MSVVESLIETAIEFTVPLVPPSVNHYKAPVKYRVRGGGVRQGFAVTPEGMAFKAAVAVLARGRSIAYVTPSERRLGRYRLDVKVFLGVDQRGDGDNFWKCIGDGVKEAGVIHSDARVRVWNLEVCDEDRENPRTEIRASRYEREAKD